MKIRLSERGLGMIVTVTMNPAIDKTVEIGEFQYGGLNRIQKVEYDAGGKGINVSRTIRELGGSSIATGFLGGNTGKTIENVMNELEIESEFIWVEGETRTNTKVFDEHGVLTELNEPGVKISKKHIDELLCKLEKYAGEQTLFVLSGSVPAGVDKGIYAKIIDLVHKKGAKVLLDADGELFYQALEAKPDMIKPNNMELEEYAQLPFYASETELAQIADTILKKGIPMIAVSMGNCGALFVTKNRKIKCPAVSVRAHSTVGAGDAMVAAMAYAWEQNMDEEEMIRLCMAVSAGAVTTIGTKPPAKELVAVLKEHVVLEEFYNG